ncbi:precorrin-6A synthase (deacetylating) [Cumulibacter manganitolerans]|uniref:precorrin-6A synthase (deacetylating) n=1 Tax=Cumulibacter manganitolerans TaxID=1884992 RepID=UPI001295722D|nr:precorrin-6A synthase (deacetylating) [Cumulibacter manganitolerans]
MTRKIRIIGVGLGAPRHVTGEAVEAMNEVDVFLVPDKGERKSELLDLRRALCAELIENDRWQLRTIADPERGPDSERDARQYREGVAAWHAARVSAYVDVIKALPPGATVGFLVWGDPAFYDSTIRMVDRIAERIDVEMRVIAGISAIQVLAAEHRIPLNAIGGPVHITTGRALIEQWRRDLGTVVVMLDGHLRCRELVAEHPDLQIYWGACVGMPQQALVAGRLGDVIDEITRVRRRVRDDLGWVMDVYALVPPE